MTSKGRARRPLHAEKTLGDTTAADMMTADPMSVGPTCLLGDAIDILRTLEIRHLPVLSGSQLIGIISDRDIVSGIERSDDRQVRHVMSTNVISVRPDTRLPEIVESFVENRVGALPVVDERDGTLVGIVSYIDVLREVGRYLTS
jgi:acetoin utilization protein AcuB